jgi:hypothetical protein
MNTCTEAILSLSIFDFLKTLKPISHSIVQKCNFFFEFVFIPKHKKPRFFSELSISLSEYISLLFLPPPLFPPPPPTFPCTLPFGGRLYFHEFNPLSYSSHTHLFPPPNKRPSPRPTSYNHFASLSLPSLLTVKLVFLPKLKLNL